MASTLNPLNGIITKHADCKGPLDSSFLEQI